MLMDLRAAQAKVAAKKTLRRFLIGGFDVVNALLLMHGRGASHLSGECICSPAGCNAPPNHAMHIHPPPRTQALCWIGNQVYESAERHSGDCMNPVFSSFSERRILPNNILVDRNFLNLSPLAPTPAHGAPACAYACASEAV
jgi:hypothetical protein